MRRNVRRAFRAQIRDMRVLFNEVRNSLFLFVAVLILGAVIFRLFYCFPDTHRHPTFSQALHATFSLVFFEIVLPYPPEWPLQTLFFAIPILGLAAIGEGLFRSGIALVDKRERGQKWQVAMASTYSNHVILCGIGKVGYRVALELQKFGRDIVAIELNPDGRFVERAKSRGIPVLLEDARRTAALLNANVRFADVIIPCTDNELANLDIALDARDLNPNIKVVLRMFDPDLARRVERGFGIHTAFSTSALAAPIFAAAAMRVDIKHSFYVGEQLLNISEVTISAASRLIGWSVEKLEDDLDLSVVCLEEKGVPDLHPRGEVLLNPGAKVLLLASLETVRKVNELNGSEAPKAGGAGGGEAGAKGAV